MQGFHSLLDDVRILPVHEEAATPQVMLTRESLYESFVESDRLPRLHMDSLTIPDTPSWPTNYSGLDILGMVQDSLIKKIFVKFKKPLQVLFVFWIVLIYMIAQLSDRRVL